MSGNDASQNIDIEYIEEKYEQLVCLIKNKNSTINIYLCSICPRGDTCVDDINDMIKRQSDIHGGTFIDIHKSFYNKFNQLKSHFYKPRDNRYQIIVSSIKFRKCFANFMIPIALFK